MRLFVAIELPDQLKARLAAMRTEIAGARWVAAEQLHLTLAFLGEVAQERLEALCATLAEVRQAPFELHFDKLGCFSHHRNPRVLWIGFEQQPALLQLAEQINRAVISCGIPLEERPFNAHITLARLKQTAGGEVAPFLAVPPNGELPHLAVREFVLFQSLLTAQGALHKPLRQFILDERLPFGR